MVKKTTLIIIGVIITYFVFSTFSSSGKEATIQKEATIHKLLATIAAGLYFGLLAVFYVLPALSQKAAQAMFADPDEKTEPSILQEARALVAQGDYENAIIAYRKSIIAEPSNRLAWTDMAKLQATKLQQPTLAIASLREAYEEHEWSDEDASHLLFRISEWQFDECDDREAGIKTLREVIEDFPRSRFSANAMSQLRELGCEVDIEPA